MYLKVLLQSVSYPLIEGEAPDISSFKHYPRGAVKKKQ